MTIKHLSLILIVVLVLASSSGLEAAKKLKEKPYQSQAGRSFVNEESAPAYGLVVQLSKKAVVVTNPETGKAGPFKNVQGNGSTQLTLSNSGTPIEPGVEAFRLIFRSYPSGLKIQSWWWTHQKGKRLGKKKSG